MSENGKLAIDLTNRVATLEFYHPKGNSLPGRLLRELADAIEAMGEREDAGVIVIRSKGDGAFCAGASFDELRSISSREEGKAFFMGFARVLNAMRLAPKLTVVRVQGKTVGGGVGIAAGGDYTLAHRSAAVKLSELALGIGPFVVGPAVERKIGGSAFGTLAIDAANWYEAEWALDKGLYARLCATQEELDLQTDQFAERLAGYSPEAMLRLKRVLWQDSDHWDRLLEQRAEISGELVLSEATQKFLNEFSSRS